jgi:hypothetical protein
VSARVTGVQAALAGFAGQLDRWREQFGPHEYAILLDLLRRRLERELERAEPPPLRECAGAREREAVR